MIVVLSGVAAVPGNKPNQHRPNVLHVPYLGYGQNKEKHWAKNQTGSPSDTCSHRVPHRDNPGEI